MKIILLPKTTILRNAQSGPHPLLIAEKSEINSQRSITVDITSIGAVHDRAISAALEPSAICGEHQRIAATRWKQRKVAPNNKMIFAPHAAFKIPER
jgi:hypothetical protein